MQLPEYLTNITAVVLAHARESAQLTQAKAAKLVYLSAQTRWAEYESGVRNMDPARFELFLLFTDQHPRFRLARRRGLVPPEKHGVAAVAKKGRRDGSRAR